jgi:hypothetical protein
MGAGLLVGAGMLLTPAEGLAQVTGQWDFRQGTLTATVGRNLGYFDGEGGATATAVQFGTTTDFGVPSIAGTATPVLRVPKNTSAMGLVLYPDMTANGGGLGVNRYSVVMDVLFPAASAGKARSLLQLEDPFVNNVDAALSVGSTDGIGADGVFHGTLAPETWNRVVVTVDLTTTPPSMTKYNNGAWVGRQSLSQGVDGRWSMNDRLSGLGSDAALLFTDRNGASEVVYVSSLQVHNDVLPPTYVAALGGATADKIPATVTPKALVGPLQPAPGDLLAEPGLPLEAQIFEGAQPIPESGIEWLLDGVAITAQITRPSPGVLVLRHDPGLLAPSSAHVVTLRFNDPSSGQRVDAGTWSFTMAPYNLPPLNPAIGSMLYLPFDEASAPQGGVVQDLSPEANNGIVRLVEETGDHSVAGVLGRAFDFKEATADYVELTKPWSAFPNSFSVWVKVPTTIPDATRVGVILGTFDAVNNINWELHTLGRPRIYWNAGAPDWNVSGHDFRTDEWEHLAFVRNPQTDTLVLYRNGRRLATRTGVGADVRPTVPSFVGADRRASGTPHFRGALDELVVYPQSLSDTEIWRLYARALTLPRYTFASPQVIEVEPRDGSARQSLQPSIVARIDEVNSQTRVDRTSVQMRVNGAPVVTQVIDEGGYLNVRHVPTAALTPGSTNVVVVTYLSTGTSPVAGRSEWTFVTATLPTITSEPVDRSVVAGATVAFQAVIRSTPPLTLQWRRGSSDLAGATNATLTLTNVQPAQAGLYSLVARDAIGEVTSRAARLEVRSALPEDPAESLGIGLAAHWPFDTDLRSPVFGFDATARNGAAVASPGRIGAGALQVSQALLQSVGVSRPVIADNSLTYSAAGWFKVTGGTGRRFLWETSPANWAISTEITPAGTLKVFIRNSNSISRDLDTQIVPGLDVWNHVAVVMDAALGEAAIYYNGARIEQPLLLETGVGTGATTGFNIGTYRAADGRFFEGFLDDVAVWDRALLAAEVVWLAAGNGVPAPRTSTLDPLVFVTLPQASTNPVGSTLFLSGAATGTAPLAYQWRRNGVNITGATRTNLVLGLTNIANGGQYTVVVSDAEKSLESPAATVVVLSLPAQPEVSLPVGLSSRWSFDGNFAGSNPAYDGAPIRGASLTNIARVGGGSLTVSQAAQQYLDVTAPVIPDGTLTYSVAGWFRVTGGTGRRFLWETAPSNWAISAEITAAGQLQVFVRQSSLNSLSLNTGLTPAAGAWHHLAAVFDAVAGEVRVFVDGTRTTNSLVISAGLGTAPTTGFHIGSYRAGDARFFDGQLDEVGVWTRHLTASEIQFLAAGNAIVPPPFGPLELTEVGVTPAGFRLAWRGGKPPYTVQSRTALGAGDWMTVGAPTTELEWVDPAPAVDARFFRVLGTP